MLLACTGCAGPGNGDETGAATAEEELLAQRDEAGETATALVEGALDVLGGEVLETQGRWEGCTSRFPEGYEDFHYVAVVRLAAGPDAPEQVLGDLERVAEASGYDVGPTGERSVPITDGAVSASLADVPDLGAEGDVLISLSVQPCVPVPSDTWQDWLARDDPGPPV
ncbi:MAG: hypothetical protein WBP61_19700 [Nocardioides sp.]